MCRPLLLLASFGIPVGMAGCKPDYDVNAQKRVLSTTQATFDAGMVAVNDRETMDVIVYSTGQGDLTIYDILVEDEEHWSVSPGWQDFDEDEDSETLFLAGGFEEDPDSAIFEVVFMPDAEETYRTVLTIISNDSEVTERDEEDRGIWKIVLRGIGRYPCGIIYPTFHDYGPRAAGGYFSEPITVENCGGVTLTIADFNPVGSTSFSIQSSTPVYVLPGEKDDIEAAFEPGGGAPAASAVIDVVSNAPNLSTQTISVVGNDCSLSVNPEWDGDDDGWFPCAGDCNDDEDGINPGVPEQAGNGIDDDCNGSVDEAADRNTDDDDGDGFTDNDGDCNDADETVFPGATEQLNQLDDDCDRMIDESTEWYDDDGDLYSERQGDCDDADQLVYPGAPERQNGADEDCDGQIDEGFHTFDDDYDGFAELGEAGEEEDCNDADPWTFPGAVEDCDDRDNDCDGLVDEGEDDSPDGACAFLVEREVAAEAPRKGCSTLPGGATGGALIALLSLLGLRRRSDPDPPSSGSTSAGS